MADVLITPASGIIEFKDNSGNLDGKIELSGTGNIEFTSPGGRLIFDDSQFISTIIDGTGTAGSTGQILSSTGTGISWINTSSVGVGSATNSDFLDNLDSTQFLRSDVYDQYDGQVAGRRIRFRMVDSQNAGSSSGDLSPLEIFQNVNASNSDAFMTFHISGRYARYFGLDRETNDLFTGGWSVGAIKNKIWHAGNDGSGSGLDADLLDGLNATSTNTASTIVARDSSGNFNAGTITATLSGNASTATTFSTNRTNYKGVTDGAVSGQLMWKNYGNNYTIFDASNSTSPNGGAINDTNPDVGWQSTFPTLMGWNGANTCGVRVDSARISDTATTLATTRTIWGQNFNGSDNVSGAITGATSITASSNISIGGELNFSGAANKYIDFYTDNDAGALSTAHLRLVNNANTSFHSAIHMTRGGAVTLYHNNSAKLATSSTGVSITGTLSVSSNTLVTNLNADLIDGIEGSDILRLSTSQSVSASDIKSFLSQNTELNNANGGQSSLQCLGAGGGAAAFMTFHRPGDFAAYFGIRASDNRFAIGGWSLGGASYPMIIGDTYNNTTIATFGTSEADPANSTGPGVSIGAGGLVSCSRSELPALRVSRRTNDGRVAEFLRNQSVEGYISISGTTTSYNAFLGTHWGRLASNSKEELLPGTILESIGEVLVWKFVSFEVDGVQRKIPYFGNLPIGEVIEIEYEGNTYAGTVNDETSELNKHVYVKVSDVPSSNAVYGVFLDWDCDVSEIMDENWNDLQCASIGNYFIRISPDEIVKIGDLIESDGTGCGKVQDDDIIRSKTVGKVISTIKQKIYDDGSYLVAAVLYCG